MPDAPDLVDLAARIRSAAADLATLAPDVEAGAPWPLSDSIGTAPEAHWGPPETLAHVAEMLPFWTGEIERVLAGPEPPVPFGRIADNELRIGVIDRDRTLPARELFARIASGAERLAARLGELTPEQAAREGRHQTLGVMSVAGIAERFVASHLAEHATQLREGLRGG